MRYGREIIITIAPGIPLLEIDAANVKYVFIMLIFFEQFFTVFEKRMVGQTIIFNDDPVFHFVKKPSDRSTHSLSATQILFPVKRFHFTRPVNTVNDLAGLPT